MLDGVFELSHLTRSRNQLWSDLLANLEGSGSSLTLSEAELIAAARDTYGGSISAKTTSRSALIASLANAAGGNVSEKTHSEGQMLAALATALGGTASALSSSFEESLAVAVEETSGEGAPEWVPDGAKVYIDLVGGAPQGRAWVHGTGEVAVNTLLGDDADAEAYWGEATVEYNATYLTANGYGRAASAVGVALSASALTKILGSVTGRVQFKSFSTTAANGLIVLAADGGNAIHLDLSYAGVDVGDLDLYTFNGLSLNIPDVADEANGALNAIAFTYAGSRCEIAANGSTVETGEITEAVRPPGNPFTSALIFAAENKFVQTITLYDALPSTVGLDDLSEPI